MGQFKLLYRSVYSDMGQCIHLYRSIYSDRGQFTLI